MSAQHDHLEPRDPGDEGVAEQHPRPAQEEAAHQLAAQAKPTLAQHGFTDEQVIEWADAYLAEEGGAPDVDAFVEWIRIRES